MSHLNAHQFAEWLTTAETDGGQDPHVLRHLEGCAACRALLVKSVQCLQSASYRLADPLTHGCPDDLTLAAYGEGRLALVERALVDQHIQSCVACREAVDPPLISAARSPGAHLPAWGRRIFAHRRALIAAAVLLFAGLGLILSYSPGQRLEAAETPDWVYQAQWLRADGNPASVLSVLDEGLQRDPGQIMGVLLKARTLLRLHRLNDAKRLSSDLLLRSDLAWVGHAVLAEIARLEGDETSRQYHLDCFAEKRPGPSDPAYRESLIYLAMVQGDAHAEIAALDHVLEASPANRDARYLRACGHRELAARNDRDRCGQDHAEAMLQDADQLVRRFPSWAHAWTARAEANRILRQYALAIEDCNTAIRLEPHAAAYMIRGQCLRRLNRAEAALRDFYQVFNMHPSRRQAADAYIALALAYRDLPKYGVVMRQALDELNLSIEQGSEDIVHYAYRCKGVIHLLNGQNARARADFESALARSPGNAYASLLLWQVLQAEGESEKAAGIIRDALAAVEEDLQDGHDRSGRSWQALLVGYYAGRVNREDLIAEATSSSRHCEASYYIGEKALHDEGPAAARIWFERCVASDVRHLDEYHLAQYRLDRPVAKRTDGPRSAAADSGSNLSALSPIHRS